MSSYQNLETRLRSVEDLLLFISQSARMKGFISSGIVDADGKMQGEYKEGTLLDFYRLHKAENLPIMTAEKENG